MEIRTIKLNIVNTDYPVYVNPKYIVLFAPAETHRSERTLITMDTQINGTNVTYEVYGNVETISELIAGDFQVTRSDEV